MKIYKPLIKNLMAGGISFEDYEDAIEIFQTLENSQNTVIVEIT